MDLVLLKKLMKMVDESTISNFEYEEEGLKIKLSKGSNAIEGQMPIAIPSYQLPYSEHTVSKEISTSERIELTSTAIDEDNSDGLYEICSPIVGTFYRSPSPENPAFVEVGSQVSEGTTLCIVEAMKLMNEIESDVSGKIVKVLAENGKPVEYNQPLFLIKLD